MKSRHAAALARVLRHETLVQFGSLDNSCGRVEWKTYATCNAFTKEGPS